MTAAFSLSDGNIDVKRVDALFNPCHKVAKMKDSFFQRIFDRNHQESKSRSRRLSLESLENRELLNVDWGGFSSETTSEYSPSTSAAYSVDLPSNVDSVNLVNLEGDSKDELVSIYGRGKTVSVYTCTSDGVFTLKTEQTISTLGNWGMYSDVTFGDLNNDGYDDMVVVSSTGMALTATIYTWNTVNASFTEGSSYALDVTPFVDSSSPRYVFTEFSSALIANPSGGFNLGLQVATLTPSSSTKAFAVYNGLGTSSFGSNPASKPAITGSLLGSTTINGESYLLLKESTASTNYLVLSKLGSRTTTKTYYDFSSYGSKFVFDWVVEKEGFLVVGAVLGGTGSSGIVTLNVKTAPEDGATVDASTLGQWFSSDSVTLNASSMATLGDCGGDVDPELLIANSDERSSVFYLGDASTTYGYTFTSSEVVISSPDYVSVYVGDGDNDGEKEALLIGSMYAYVADVDSSGALSNQREIYRFAQPVSQAVFGDFDGDGLVDIAVRYRANVGSSLQVFRQISGGAFVSLATQTVPGSFTDLTVGRFSQASVDEVAVLSTQYKNGVVGSSVYCYKLNTSTSSLSLVYSTTYMGVGSNISSGKLYDLWGSGRDDLVVTNTSEDTVTVLRNTGSSLTPSTVTTRYEGTNACYPTSSAIGDFNGDGLADLAVMNSSMGSNFAELVYYLRSESGGLGSKPTGRIRVNGTATASDNTSLVGELQCADLNGDGYSDLVFVRKSTDGASYVSSFMGNGATGVFDPIINDSISCDPASNAYGVTLAMVNPDDISYDFVWAQTKTFGALLNNDSVVSSSKVQYVLQSRSAAAGNSLEGALSTQRTWLDEWSNFYIDVWATTGDEEDFGVTSVSGQFNYNPDYFVLSSVTGVNGYTVNETSASGSVNYTVTGSGTHDTQGWTLVARMLFVPVVGGGLSLHDDGKMYSVSPGFNAAAASQTVNGARVTAAVCPKDVSVYPLAFDLNDNGEVDGEDFALCVSYYPTTNLETITVPKHRILDINGNGTYDIEDFTVLLTSFSLKSTSGKDSIYQTEPQWTTLSSVIEAAALDGILTSAALDKNTELEFFEDETDAAVTDALAFNVTERTVEQRAFTTEYQTAKTSRICGPMPLNVFQDIDLDVDLDLDF